MITVIFHIYMKTDILIPFFVILAPPSPLIGSDGEHSQHSMSLPGQVSFILYSEAKKFRLNSFICQHRLHYIQQKIQDNNTVINLYKY